MRQDDDEMMQDLLRESTAPVPYDDVDWRTLHAEIVRRAQPHLRRTPPTWWHLVAGWSSRGIPLGAAAAAALVIALGTGLVDTRRESADTPDVATFTTIEEELAAAAPLLVADADSDALIEAMLLYDGGEW